MMTFLRLEMLQPRGMRLSALAGSPPSYALIRRCMAQQPQERIHAIDNLTIHDLQTSQSQNETLHQLFEMVVYVSKPFCLVIATC
jgi:hypothetical protein